MHSCPGYSLLEYLILCYQCWDSCDMWHRVCLNQRLPDLVYFLTGKLYISNSGAGANRIFQVHTAYFGCIYTSGVQSKTYFGYIENILDSYNIFRVHIAYFRFIQHISGSYSIFTRALCRC